MNVPINFDKVADIYDFYVNVDFDIPFFLKETENTKSEILELMCGTGRVSVPLLEAGRKMTCIDYSVGMLDIFSGKIEKKDYDVELINMDVTSLHLNKKFDLIILPFHSITEILSTKLQYNALESISKHLNKNGVFILTLQNPKTRLKTADGTERMLGEIKIDDNRKMVIYSMNQFNPSNKIVSGFQSYEIFDANNIMVEKRVLDICFKPISDSELKDMINNLGLEISATYGDYSYSRFDEETSDFMIYKIVKR